MRPSAAAIAGNNAIGNAKAIATIRSVGSAEGITKAGAKDLRERRVSGSCAALAVRRQSTVELTVSVTYRKRLAAAPNSCGLHRVSMLLLNVRSNPTR